MTTYSKEFESAHAAVIAVLKEDERARNDDLWLILRVWQQMQHIKVYVPYEKLNEMINEETITRARRKLNERGLYLPTNPKVREKRGIREEEAREYHGRVR